MEFDSEKKCQFRPIRVKRSHHTFQPQFGPFGLDLSFSGNPSAKKNPEVVDLSPKLWH